MLKSFGDIGGIGGTVKKSVVDAPSKFSKTFTSIAGGFGGGAKSPTKPKGESGRGLMAFGRKKSK